MSFAPNYTPITGFATDESNNVAGRSTVKTVSLDTELANISASINALNNNLKALQRDDGKVKDLLIEPFMLSEQARALVATGGVPRGDWVAGTAYAVKDVVQHSGFAYICHTAHTSTGTFDATKWIGISGDGSAAASAAAASASQTAAATSATNAATSATNAANSATTATTQATNAATSATNAANSATTATTQATNAATSATNAANSATAAANSAAAAANTPVAVPTHAATSKATPVDADELPLADSAASFVLKKLTWANLKATLKTYFDTLYQVAGSYAALTGNSGQAFSVGTPAAAAHAVRADSIMRQNAIINGGCQVVTRAAQNITTTPVYGPVDRFFSYCSGLTVTTAGLNVNSGWNESTLTGCSLWSAMTTTSGTGKVFQGQRIEAKNVRHFANKTARVRVKIYHDLGSTINFTIAVSKANAEDNFSGKTSIGSISGDVPTGVWTYLEGTVALGTNTRTGIEILLYNTSDIAWNGKSLHTSEWFFNDTDVAGVFEPRPYGLELALCRRYYEEIGDGSINYETFGIAEAVSSTSAYQCINFSKKRTTPSVTVSAAGDFQTAAGGYVPSSVSVSQITSLDAFISWTFSSVLTTGNAKMLRGNNTSAARISISAEL